MAVPSRPPGDPGCCPRSPSLAARTRPLVSPAWWDRFVTHLEHTFSAQRVENLRRREAAPSSLAEFKVVRREASTTDVCYDLVEACEDAEVPNAFRYSFACRRLADALSDFTTMTNDVFGVDRDTDNGDPNNYVTVIQRARGLDRDEAVVQATADVAALVGEPAGVAGRGAGRRGPGSPVRRPPTRSSAPAAGGGGSPSTSRGSTSRSAAGSST
ncbi:hypothetical protein GCM10025868_45440 [Angustibacter aerolatus]|uniref:Terpene synthase n=1 Tax=Angustibacter aerolatus TaxID=1162965 RepID=A0ABQ6JMY8_9ACTN|nr:hypothetical protein GCM10025868_45440 [Angustibacter aerolatus]